jgi:hypothetical protein
VLQFSKVQHRVQRRTMTYLKKLTSLNNCKLTMINFVVCFCGGVVGVGNLCCNLAEFNIVHEDWGSIPPQVTVFWILCGLFLFC